MIYAGDIIWNGRPLLNQAIKKGMSMTEVTLALSCFISNFDEAFRMGTLDYVALGLDKCDLEGDDYSIILLNVLNKMIANTKTIQQALGNITTVNTQTNTYITNSTDEKVKVSAKDTTPGYLSEKIKSAQPGTLVVNADNITLIGFVPIGAIIMIDAAFLSKFDTNGLGKADTDASCFAISNGQNGTKNRLGKFPRWATTLATAGNTGGNNSVTLTKENIPSFDIPVSGSISDALVAPVVTKTKFDKQIVKDSGGSTWVPKIGTGRVGSEEVQSLDLDLKHSHAFNLSGKYSNAVLKELQLLPLYIDEVPIQRIK